MLVTYQGAMGNTQFTAWEFGITSLLSAGNMVISQAPPEKQNQQAVYI